jgi:hypothetical protein
MSLAGLLTDGDVTAAEGDAATAAGAEATDDGESAERVKSDERVSDQPVNATTALAAISAMLRKLERT